MDRRPSTSCSDRGLPSVMDEGGFTMIEILIATAMMIIISAAAVSMLVSVMRAQPNETTRADQIGTARNVIETVTADIRQGVKAVPSGRSQVTLTTYCDKSSGATESCQVVYACTQEAGVTPTSYKCTRKVGSEAAVTVVSKLASSSVFCFVPSTTAPACANASGTEASYVGIQLEIWNPGARSVTVLEDGAALHNSPTYKG